MIHEKIYLKDYYDILGENGRNPALTLYLPDNSPEINRQNKKLPCLLICPGGAYAWVSPREAEPIALNFLTKGYNVFVLDYSVSPNTFPAQMLEVAAAMELIHANEEKWGCDAGKVAIMGFSAGGHLAGHYATCYDCSEVRAVFPDSKAVQASVLCYPVITADPVYGHIPSFLCLTGKNELTPEMAAKFSLEKQVKETTPPAFLWHTSADAAVPVMNSLLYAQALAEHNVPFALRIYPDGAHGMATADEQTCMPDMLINVESHEWMSAAARWLKDTL